MERFPQQLSADSLTRWCKRWLCSRVAISTRWKSPQYTVYASRETQSAEYLSVSQNAIHGVLLSVLHETVKIFSSRRILPVYRSNFAWQSQATFLFHVKQRRGIIGKLISPAMSVITCFT